MAQTAQAPEEEITAGDYYATTIVLTGVDYSAKTMNAEVRQTQAYNGTLLGTFVIDSKTYSGGNTTVAMHLTKENTRTIGTAGGGYWDLQVQISGSTQPHTVVGGYYRARPDVTA